LVAIEIADQTNAERDAVQVIAVHMAAVDLPTPTVADLDLAVAGRCTVSDDEMISHAVQHAANMSMVVIKDARVALARAAVVHDDELPARTRNRRTIDLCAHGTAEITVACAAAAAAATAK